MNIAVIGAGVVGAATSLAIKEAFPVSRVTVFADAFSPQTTGDGSAGLWTPYLLGSTPAEDVLRWSGETYRWMLSIWKSESAGDAGVSLIPITRVTSDARGVPEQAWTSTVFGSHRMSLGDLRRLNEEQAAEYTSGWQFITFTAEPTRLIPWILAKFKSLGGNIVKRKISKLDELVDESFDLLVNCTGLGARDLIGDATMQPVRGQVSRVEASWAFHVFLVEDEAGNYVIPNVESVVLGGTHQENDYDCRIREEDEKFIHEGCCKLLPALRECNIIKRWVGLRPGRPRVRLETESREAENGKKFTVIHNYGHGGSGVTLCWGCALDVVRIVHGLKAEKNLSKL
ncbi:D-aspartate oxidase [Neodiprion pinetum]|uniref:D-aspartate oxidase n=1 Tax=Neodiprion pinetum TaxID=441929 RepID=UPI001EDD009E|nr:D-aspartate oxidase [Neodiprion pinetum]